MPILTKEKVFKQIREGLRNQISEASKAVEQAREAFRVGDERAENRGERGAIQERSWLLSAQATRLDELRRQLFVIESTPLEACRAVSLGALVLVEEPCSQRREIYLLHPALGGTEIEVDGLTLLAVSPASPMGAALMGRTEGDAVEVELPAANRRLTILEVN